MRYWWVNHKQTSKFEIAGGFLWSPMRKKNNSRNQFYDNMRLASPGDAVISFSHGKIRYIGLVAGFASAAPKPPSFGSAGAYWSEQGWLLAIKWQPLPKTIIPKEEIEKLREFLPLKYSPIHSATGHGRQNAYLAEVGKPIYDILLGGDDFFNVDSYEYLAEFAAEVASHLENSIEKQVLDDRSLDDTVKATLFAARRGQGVFRERIYEFEKGCRLTEIYTPELLVASHIKPWSLCTSAAERLDGANGLLLTPHVDRLFDRGLVSFEDDGTLLISSRLSLADLGRLGLGDALKKKFGSFHSRQKKYLSYHRDKVFSL
ncbi:HNH endonuclease [Pseudomonas folii]|uniref:HNH endonuclease n=1 Tax=Pseudomonas folii TaxID=2762593 RepID=A0ABR7B811_9PSED|nr:HNH endonuclease [Pseudomonas folii]MBC3953045.1 HNH endonuclease [Pseudomonas folii]